MLDIFMVSNFSAKACYWTMDTKRLGFLYALTEYRLFVDVKRRPEFTWYFSKALREEAADKDSLQMS
jgi:hypothetical protein